MKLKYRLPKLQDKEIITDYINEHYAIEEIHLSASNNLTSENFEDWVKKINDNTIIPDNQFGKSLLYLAFDECEKLIGLLQIRFDLPQDKIMKYGHIGYGVRPSERRKGYATQMLKYALEECKKLGMENVIIGCNKRNIGSAKVIINNKGKLIAEIEKSKIISDYWKLDFTIQFYEITYK